MIKEFASQIENIVYTLGEIARMQGKVQGYTTPNDMSSNPFVDGVDNPDNNPVLEYLYRCWTTGWFEGRNNSDGFPYTFDRAITIRLEVIEDYLKEAKSELDKLQNNGR